MDGWTDVRTVDSEQGAPQRPPTDRDRLGNGRNGRCKTVK